MIISAEAPPQATVEKKENGTRYKFENKQIKFVMIPRSHEQMAAFYEGRGFPKNAIDKVTKSCFITAGLRNLTQDIVWLDLADWRFSQNGKLISHYGRDYWKQTWPTLELPLAKQATFNWTLMPEQRDLHPDEPVGGNIVLPQSDQAFHLRIEFKTGTDKKGKPILLELDNIKCDNNPAP